MIQAQNISVHPKNGLSKTFELMNYLESKSFYNPGFVKFVHENFSSNCLACVPGKIWNYMKNNFQYISDDPFDEILTAPYLMPSLKRGDCDDFSLFAKTCIDILGGFNSSYILFAKEKNRWSHIACFVNRGSFNNNFIDPVIIDGANDNFNLIGLDYKYYKIV